MSRVEWAHVTATAVLVFIGVAALLFCLVAPLYYRLMQSADRPWRTLAQRWAEFRARGRELKAQRVSDQQWERALDGLDFEERFWQLVSGPELDADFMALVGAIEVFGADERACSTECRQDCACHGDWLKDQPRDSGEGGTR